MGEEYSLNWWVSSGVAGMLGSVAAYYAIRGGDKSYGFLSKLRAKHSEKREAKRQNRINGMASEPSIVHYHMMQFSLNLHFATTGFMIMLVAIVTALSLSLTGDQEDYRVGLIMMAAKALMFLMPIIGTIFALRAVGDQEEVRASILRKFEIDEKIRQLEEVEAEEPPESST